MYIGIHSNYQLTSNYQSKAFGNKKFLPRIGAKSLGLTEQEKLFARLIQGLTAAAFLALINQFTNIKFPFRINACIQPNNRDYIDELSQILEKESALKENASIKEHINSIKVCADDSSLNESKGDLRNIKDCYTAEKAKARLMVLMAYLHSNKMQANSMIYNQIGELTSNIKKTNQAIILIRLLANNVYNNDPIFFNSLNSMLKDNIQPKLIEKVMSNESLYINIKPETLYIINGTNERIVPKVERVLDKYLDCYSKSEVISAKLDEILNEAFCQLEKDPYEFALNKFLKKA